MHIPYMQVFVIRLVSFACKDFNIYMFFKYLLVFILPPIFEGQNSILIFQLTLTKHLGY